MKEPVKLLCEHLQIIIQKDIQQDCLELYDNVVRAYLEEYPGLKTASIFMGDLITIYTCADCSHFTATVTKETAIQIKLIIASSRVSCENLLWNTMSGSSDYRERKCSECNNGNIFKDIIFNGESPVIKVFHLLRACDTNQEPNRMKVKIPFEVEFVYIYILPAAINFCGPTVTSRHYNCHLFTKNYTKLCDDETVTTKATKTVLRDQSFQESVYILFCIQRNAFQKESFESIFHTSLENQDKIRDLWLQKVSNGCQIDYLIPNVWINGIVVNAFLKEVSKTSSYSNAVFYTDIFQNILGGRLKQEYQNALVNSDILQ